MDRSKVPPRGHPDRKRVLNILAQRRYRDRRRAKLAVVGSILSNEESRHGAFTPDDSAVPPSANGAAPVPMPSSDAQADDNIFRGGFFWEPLPAYPYLPDLENECAMTAGLGSTNEDGTLDPSLVLLGAYMTPPSTSDNVFPSESASPEDQLQELEVSQFTFPDDATIDVPQLQVIRAGLEAARLLGCEDALWDLSCTRTFDTSQLGAVDPPRMLKSTSVQRRVPHLAVFDVLPFPTLRDKLICVFAQPACMRPPAARDENAVMSLMYDIEDDKDGFRIHGSNGFDLGSWEVGERFFKNWWWALDQAIVNQSDRFRLERGLKRLSLTN